VDEGRAFEVPPAKEIFSMSDPELFEWREQARAEMAERPTAYLRATYELSTQEVADRAADART
jgi:hypothetical protein